MTLNRIKKKREKWMKDGWIAWHTTCYMELLVPGGCPTVLLQPIHLINLILNYTNLSELAYCRFPISQMA